MLEIISNLLQNKIGIQDVKGIMDFMKDLDFEKAVNYCTSILVNCPYSIHHNCLKVEYMLRANQMKEANKFTNELMMRQSM